MTNFLEGAVRESGISRGAGYGMELPCKFKFQGNKFPCEWLEKSLKKENFDIL